jgi:hypothetical protein
MQLHLLTTNDNNLERIGMAAASLAGVFGSHEEKQKEEHEDQSDALAPTAGAMEQLQLTGESKDGVEAALPQPTARQGQKRKDRADSSAVSQGDENRQPESSAVEANKGIAEKAAENAEAVQPRRALASISADQMNRRSRRGAR